MTILGIILIFHNWKTKLKIKWKLKWKKYKWARRKKFFLEILLLNQYIYILLYSSKKTQTKKTTTTKNKKTTKNKSLTSTAWRRHSAGFVQSRDHGALVVSFRRSRVPLSSTYRTVSIQCGNMFRAVFRLSASGARSLTRSRPCYSGRTVCFAPYLKLNKLCDKLSKMGSYSYPASLANPVCLYVARS